MQVAIDNAKRRFDIDLTEEIYRIKEDMNIKENGFPKFWSVIRKDFNQTRINKELICPMNYIYDLKLNKFRNKQTTLPMSHFFVKHELDEQRRKCKKVEELIQKYSLQLYDYNIMSKNDTNEEYLLLRNDFDKLIYDIQTTYISKNYAGLMSWLINRAFCIGSGIKSNQNIMKSTIDSNKSLLLKVLYTLNPSLFLSCFA